MPWLAIKTCRVWLSVVAIWKPLPFEILSLNSFVEIEISQNLGEEPPSLSFLFFLYFTCSFVNTGSTPSESCPTVLHKYTLTSAKRTLRGTEFHHAEFISNTLHLWSVPWGSWWIQQVSQSSWWILWKEHFCYCAIQWTELVDQKISLFFEQGLVYQQNTQLYRYCPLKLLTETILRCF